MLGRPQMDMWHTTVIGVGVQRRATRHSCITQGSSHTRCRRNEEETQHKGSNHSHHSTTMALRQAVPYNQAKPRQGLDAAKELLCVLSSLACSSNRTPCNQIGRNTEPQ
jgi:hypothetical protein